MLFMTRLPPAALFAALAVFWLTPPPVHAQASGEPAINAYCEDPGAQLPLREIRSHTVIAGPVAKTQIAYVIANKNTVRTEVGINFHLPPDTVLTAFGYYYQGRFIRGKMYDTNEAWKIYTAVTSRGRDPGIMERNSAQDYHVQVYPVEARRDLRVVVELSQALVTDRVGAHFELPLTQEENTPSDVQVNSDVLIRGHAPGEVASSDDTHTSKSAHDGGTHVRLTGRWRPAQNWTLTLKRQTSGVARSIFSSLNPSRRNGYYALAATAPYKLVSPRV